MAPALSEWSRTRPIPTRRGFLSTGCSLKRAFGALCESHAPVDLPSRCQTKWLQEHGVRAAKDVLTIEQYHKARNHLEDKYKRVRIPAAEFAEKVLQ